MHLCPALKEPTDQVRQARQVTSVFPAHRASIARMKEWIRLLPAHSTCSVWRVALFQKLALMVSSVTQLSLDRKKCTLTAQMDTIVSRATGRSATQDTSAMLGQRLQFQPMPTQESSARRATSARRRPLLTISVTQARQTMTPRRFALSHALLAHTIATRVSKIKHSARLVDRVRHVRLLD